jgi:hypothetical protein
VTEAQLLSALRLLVVIFLGLLLCGCMVALVMATLSRLRVPHWLAHRWAPWEQYEAEVQRQFVNYRTGEVIDRGKAVARRQRRTCTVCHKEQIERVQTPEADA